MNNGGLLMGPWRFWIPVTSGAGVSHGTVHCTAEEAKEHNRVLDEAMLKGLDDNCQVGQCGTFYYCGDGQVTTFCGTVIALAARYGKVGIVFVRKGRTFKGRISKHAQCVTFMRTA